MASSLNIESTDINTGPNVELNSNQKTLVGSVLDLFIGKPSLEKLALWSDDATFEDPLAVAKGRKQYEAQWYSLELAFSELERLSHQVTSAANPISTKLKMRYVVKGIKKEVTINSIVNIFVNSQGKIETVEDRWDGNLPDNNIQTAFRRLNAVALPNFVSAPKNAEEDAKRGH